MRTSPLVITSLLRCAAASLNLYFVVLPYFVFHTFGIVYCLRSFRSSPNIPVRPLYSSSIDLNGIHHFCSDDFLTSSPPSVRGSSSPSFSYTSGTRFYPSVVEDIKRCQDIGSVRCSRSEKDEGPLVPHLSKGDVGSSFPRQQKEGISDFKCATVDEESNDWVEITACCDAAYESASKFATSQLNAFQMMMEQGKIIPAFGTKADALLVETVDRFLKAQGTPRVRRGKSYDLWCTRLHQLEKAVGSGLHSLFLQQLQLIQQEAIRTYRQTARAQASIRKQSGAEGGSTKEEEEDPMSAAESYFKEQADKALSVKLRSSTPDGGRETQMETGDRVQWSYKFAQRSLMLSLKTLDELRKERDEGKVSQSDQQRKLIEFLQQQQSEIQMLQQQLHQMTQGSGPWHLGMAYRIPDTNLNMSAAYQEGRASVQVSCVPDESASLLGPNGFVRGVNPGNLGLSLNFSI